MYCGKYPLQYYTVKNTSTIKTEVQSCDSLLNTTNVCVIITIHVCVGVCIDFYITPSPSSCVLTRQRKLGNFHARKYLCVKCLRKYILVGAP